MARRLSRQPQQARLQRAQVSAPTGGINTVDAASAMPPTDAPYIYNMLSAEYGLRSRLGYREWCTGLTGAAENGVRSALPFMGSQATKNRLFFTTSSGLWDASASSAAPPLKQAFATSAGNAGRAVGCVFANPAGKFFPVCDEENGLYIYSEATDGWTRAAAGVTQAWAEQTLYVAGNQVVNGGNTYTCTTGGESAAGAGPAGVGAAIADGAAVWTGAAGVTANAIGPSLGDQQAGLSLDPANFAFVMQWKKRLWLVEKNSTRGWYLDVGALYGTATSFDFGPQMRAGGSLVGLYSWSYNAGNGIDSTLVGISTGGDVVIYQGTDPNSINTFGLVGSWFLGGVPAGRHIATDFGGDVLVASLLGVVPLSKLVAGHSVEDISLYATQKIANLFNRLAAQYQAQQGWALHIHPTDNALLVLVPQGDGAPTSQLAMSFATRGWSVYRDLPLACAGVWNGQLYFGTPDGRVCVNDGYVDGVQLADPNAYTPVAWSLLTSSQNGDGRLKRVQLIRPKVLCEAPSPLIQAIAKYDFDLSEPPPPTGSAVAGAGNTWDHAVWDTDVWGGDYSASAPLSGGVGIGSDVAIAVRGSAIARTVLMAIEVFFDEGGFL